MRSSDIGAGRGGQGKRPRQPTQSPTAGKKFFASPGDGSWFRGMNEAARQFQTWTSRLIDPASTPRAQLDAAHAWCTWVLRRLDMDGMQIDPPGEASAQPTRLDTGEAISPQRAVLCLREHWRTAVFLRAVDAAVEAARRQFPGEVLHLVEAGCGPAAPMALAMAARHPPEVLQVTLIDIHASSLAAARRLAAELGLDRSIRDTLGADASQVRFAESDRPHVIVAEVLRRALKKEPQVAVTRALAPQLRPGGFFLPERIEITVGELLRPQAEQPGDNWRTLGRAFTLDAYGAGELEVDTAGRLAGGTIEMSGAALERLQLFTELQVFRDHRLRPFDCSLTMPEPLRWPGGRGAAGGVIEFAYEISGDPGLRLKTHAPTGTVGREAV